MPVVILHGDNIAVVQQKIDEMKKSYPPEGIERFSLKDESFNQLLIRLGTSSFFADQRLLIVDDSDEKKIDVEKLSVDPQTTLVFSFLKELSPQSVIVKWADQNKYRVLALSQPQDKRIFTFLDLLAEKNKQAYSMINDLLSDFGGVYLLSMITFLLRRLVLPVGKVPSFVETKLKKQKMNFSEEKLELLYKQTLETDFKIKSGRVDERTGILLLVNSFFAK